MTDRLYTYETAAFIACWTKQQKDGEIHEEWDNLKLNLKRIAIIHAVRKKREIDKEKQDIIFYLEQATNDINKEERTKAKHKLNELIDKEAYGNIIRSRAEWTEKAKNQHVIFMDLKRKDKIKTLTSLRTDSGRKTTDLDIVSEAQSYYQKLYTEEPIKQEKQEIFLQSINNFLTDAERETCKAPITKQELNRAIREMANNKYPGSDGLTKEFYEHFWNKLEEPLVKVANQNYEIGKMSYSQRQALLKLLYKRNDREILHN